MTNAITIVAGGWSAGLYDLRKLPGTVIAVNDSAVYLPRVDIVLSMDRLWMEYRYPWLFTPHEIPVWLRRSTFKNVSLEDCSPSVRLFDCDHTSTTFSREPGVLNGTSSGFCALNLAYQMQPKRLYLLGFDGQRGPKGQAHWFPQYAWAAESTGAKRLAEWAEQFNLAALELDRADIETFHCSVPGASAVHAFKQLSPTDLAVIAQ